MDLCINEESQLLTISIPYYIPIHGAVNCRELNPQFIKCGYLTPATYRVMIFPKLFMHC